jgi:hypothetical protein
MLHALGRGIRSMFTRVRGITPRPSMPRPVLPQAAVLGATPRIVLSDVSRRGPPALV